MKTLKLITSIFISCNIFAQSLQVSKYVQQAIEKNPQMLAAGKNIIISKVRALQMNSLDPASVGIEFYQIPVNTPNIFNTMESDYFVQQMFPFPGKIDSRVKVEEKNIDMAGQESEYVKLKLANEVKQIFYEIYMLQRKQNITSENLLFLKQLINTTEIQYSVGKALQEDIVKAQVEYSKALQDSISIKNEMNRMIIMINTVLNRDINLSFENINDFELTKFDFDPLMNQSQTLENRPDLKAMKFNIEMSELEAKSAEKEYYPDLMLRLMYKQMGMGSPNYWSLMFSTTLPFLPWSKPMVEYKIQEKEEKSLFNKANYQAMQNMAASEVYASIYKAKENLNKIDIYKSQIIPQAELALSSNLISYQNGRTNFLMVLDSYRMLQMFRMEYYMSVAEYEKAIANYELSIGKGI